MKAKRVKDSKTEMISLMQPSDANTEGNVFGGTILRLIDEVAYIVATRHTRKNVVTAAIEHLDFLKPVYVGDFVILNAYLVSAGRTSMKICVKVEAEDPKTGKRRHTATANLVLVALDSKGKPTPVPKLTDKGKDICKPEKP